MRKIKQLSNFTIIEYTDSKSPSTYQCNDCGEVFVTTHKGRELLFNGRGSCPKCGNYEGLEENTQDILKDFRPIPEDNRYFINNKGEVISTIGKIKKLKPIEKDTYGHISHNINIGGKRKSIHHLVLEAFGYPRPSPSHIVRHLNDIPTDNRLENLKWDIQLVNMKDKKVNSDDRKSAIISAYQSGVTINDLSLISKLSVEDIKKILLQK